MGTIDEIGAEISGLGHDHMNSFLLFHKSEGITSKHELKKPVFTILETFLYALMLVACNSKFSS